MSKNGVKILIRIERIFRKKADSKVKKFYLLWFESCNF